MAEEQNIAIRVQHVSKNFLLPHERQTSLKSLLINFYKRSRGKSFEKQQALNDISFDVHEGDFFGIVGRNGSGKSTLLKLLAGIYSPTTGSVQVYGRLTPFIELGVGFSPDLTGRENVFLNGALLGFTRKEMLAMYDDIVEFAEIERFMDQKLKNYSSGMQVRLAFSIAIRAKGDILLLDEVLAVGDAAFQQKCYNYFEELKRQKRTVVFVSHDMGAVRRFCTKAIYINNGKLLLEGSPSEIADEYDVANIIENTQTSANPEDERSPRHSIATKIEKQTASELTLRISYKSKDMNEMYIGIAVLHNGISVAEVSTVNHLTLVGNGEVSYQLDTTHFNAGVYEIGVGLFRQENRELLSAGKRKNKFVLKGRDISKGAALKLADTWKAK